MIGLAAFVCTIVAIMVVDRVGRKILLLIGSVGMALSLCLLGIALRVSPHPTTLIPIAVLFNIGCFDLSLGPGYLGMLGRIVSDGGSWAGNVSGDPLSLFRLPYGIAELSYPNETPIAWGNLPAIRGVMCRNFHLRLEVGA
jgi:hypothetical protein